jgi:selenocysteine lyase/cysteine desulfurase
MSDIKAISQLGHKHGIPVMVDAYQSAGSIPIDFDEVGADFLVGGFLKYMLGLPGIGFLLVKGDFSRVPTQTGWFAARDVFAMEIERYDPATDARRFEGGTPPVPSLYAAVAGLKLLLEAGLIQAWTHTSTLGRLLCTEVENLDGVVITPQRAGSYGVMVSIKATDDIKLVASLEKEGIVASSRGGNLRISPHFYNTFEDLERLLKVLHRYQELLQ